MSAATPPRTARAPHRSGLALLALLACQPWTVPADLEAIDEPRYVVDVDEVLRWPELPPATAAERQALGDEAAVVIDVGRPPALPPRPGAAATADAWVRYFVGVRGLPSERVFLLRDGDASPPQVLAAIQTAADGLDRKARLWIIFIGYALNNPNASSDGLLLTHATPPDPARWPAAALRLFDIHREVLNHLHAPVVLVLDGCAPPGVPLPPGYESGLRPLLRGYVEKDFEVVINPGSALGADITPPRGLRGMVATAGHGAGCLAELPGGDRPALSYWLLGAVQGWADRRGDALVRGQEALRFLHEAPRQIVSVLRDDRPSLPGKTRRRLPLAADARAREPTLDELRGVGARGAVVLAGGGAITPPRRLDRWGPLLAALDDPARDPLLAALALADGRVALPQAVASAWCQLPVPAGPALAELLALECRRWSRFASRWRRFHAILDRDHRVLLRYLRRADEGAAARSLAGFLDTYAAAYPTHPRVRAIAAAAAALAAGDPRWRLTAKYGAGSWVDAATHDRGCVAGDDACEPDERPAHRVTLDEYAIALTEVRGRDYEHCVLAGACSPRDRARCYAWTGAGFELGGELPAGSLDPDAPAVCATWEQARDYCTWLGARLPSEAEWEVAARGAGPGPYPWGRAAPTCELAHHAGCGAGPRPVATTAPSEHGLWDMSGNVAEWVHDWYDKTSYRRGARNNPLGPRSGEVRGIRGGSFYDPPEMLRASYRYGLTPTFGYGFVGFRCAH